MRSALHTRIVSVAVLCCLLSTLIAPLGTPATAYAQAPEPVPATAPTPATTPAPAPPLASTAANSEWPRRLGALSVAIDAAAARERTARYTAGGLGLGLGGVMILGGVLLHDECEGESGEDACQVGAWVLGIFGTLGAIGGIVALAVKGENETAAERFAALQTIPGTSPEVAVQQGEGILKGMADNARRNRYITAGTLVASGVLMFASALGASTGEDSTTSTADAALAGLLPLALIGGWGVVEFLWPSAVERAWDDYQEQFPAPSSPAATSWLNNTYAAPVFSFLPDGNSYTGLSVGLVF